MQPAPRPAPLRLGLLLCILAAALASGAQTAAAPPPPFAMEAAVEEALASSATLEDARAAVEAARLALELSAPWRSSSLGGSLDWKGSAPDSPAGPEWSLSAALTPLSGLTLTATATESLLKSGALLRPFAKADSSRADALARALILARDAARQTVLGTRSAYRAAWLASLDLAAKEVALKSAEARAEAAALNAEAGAASPADLIAADSDRLEAEGALLDARNRLDQALFDLADLVGREVAAAELAAPDPGADRLPMPKEAFLALRADLATLGIEVAAAKRAAEPSLPDLALSGSLLSPLRSTGSRGSYSFSATLGLDPDDLLRGRDRASALDLARRVALEAESRKAAAREYEVLLARIAAARTALETARRMESSAALSYDKATYLAEAGTVSGASLYDAEASRLAAAYRAAQAGANLAALLDLVDAGLGEGAAAP